MQSQHTREVESGKRFEFGKNWKRFLSVLDDGRIAAAEQALQHMLEMGRLEGKRFLDVGCGSGIFSLAAVRLGATVHSFDYDPQSIECARMVKARYASACEWVIEEASVLDTSYLDRLGQFDVVYSWGVLHHTGAMWQALDHVAPLVKEGGMLFIAIYNDQGGVSRRWRAVKRLYNTSPQVMRPCILFPIMLYFEGREAIKQLLRGRNPLEGWVRN
ncbi:MAG: class I SAM-dependent methyltransferase, partial [Nitrospiraceae bacterium]